MALTQEDLLRQQQEKLAGIAQQQQLAQQRAPGQVVGETPEQYAAGKAAGYNLFQQRQAVAAEPQPTRQPQPVVRKQSTPVKTAPVVDPNSATSGMDAVIANMFTSPEQEERMRKASVANQRILAVGDALRHIGNIYNTVNYAPAQKFNSPVLEEQARYEKGKALRDAANLRYYSYQQAKAAQDAKAKQWEADYGLKAANYASQAAYRDKALDETKRAHDLSHQQAKDKLGAQVKQWEETNKEKSRHNKRMEGIAGMNANTNQEKAKAYIEHLKSGGGGRGTGSFIPLSTPYGTIKSPGRSIPQAQLNQLYKYALDNKYIQQGEFQKRMVELGLGKADADYVQNRLLEEAMMKHGEIGDFARDNYGWTYENDQRGTGAMLVQPQSPFQSQANRQYFGPFMPGGNMDLGLEDEEEDDMDLGLE